MERRNDLLKRRLEWLEGKARIHGGSRGLSLIPEGPSGDGRPRMNEMVATANGTGPWSFETPRTRDDFYAENHGIE